MTWFVNEDDGHLVKGLGGQWGWVCSQLRPVWPRDPASVHSPDVVQARGRVALLALSRPSCVSAGPALCVPAHRHAVLHLRHHRHAGGCVQGVTGQ